MKLYGYFRSSAAYRVRIALNLKGLEVEHIPVHLVKNGGQQLAQDYKELNPEALLPTLVDVPTDAASNEVALSQSLAILEYLEEKYPAVPLLPSDLVQRAKVRAFALAIACDIHPINNLRVLKYLGKELGLDDAQRNHWYRHWCEAGLATLEARLVKENGGHAFCFGEQPSMADCCLIPQVFNAQRFQCDLSSMPTVMRINEKCLSHDAFVRAMPANQADAE